jgi:hypothetical protein
MEALVTVWLVGMVICWWSGAYEAKRALVWPVAAYMDAVKPVCWGH